MRHLKTPHLESPLLADSSAAGTGHGLGHKGGYKVDGAAASARFALAQLAGTTSFDVVRQAASYAPATHAADLTPSTSVAVWVPAQDAHQFDALSTTGIDSLIGAQLGEFAIYGASPKPTQARLGAQAVRPNQALVFETQFQALESRVQMTQTAGTAGQRGAKVGLGVGLLKSFVAPLARQDRPEQWLKRQIWNACRVGYAAMPQSMKYAVRNGFFSVFPWAFKGSLAHQNWRLERHYAKLNLKVAQPIVQPQLAPTLKRLAALEVPTLVGADEERVPQVSIVIPTYGMLDYTLACVQSVLDNAPKATFELIVVDDASKDPHIYLLKQIPKLQWRVNENNLGFLRSVNACSERARGSYIYLLNNDVQVQAGWLDAMLGCAQRHPRSAVVGSKVLFADGRLQEAGGILWQDGTASHYGRNDDPNRCAYNYTREVDYCSGASLLIRADVWRQLGGFDERYVPAYCEDSDFAMRVRQAGWTVMYEPTSVVVHHEGVSHGAKQTAHQKNNQVKFYQRWKAVLQADHFEAQHNPSHFSARLARDRACAPQQARDTVLVIDQSVPQPDQDAGSRTMAQYVHSLVRLGFNVKFWPLDLSRRQGYTEQLTRLGVEVMYSNDGSLQLPQWLQDNAGLIHTVLLSRPEVAAGLLGLLNEVKQQHSHLRVVYYGHDIHHLRMFAQAKSTGHESDVMSLMHIRAMQQMETQSWLRCDAVLYPSDEEAQFITDWYTLKSATDGPTLEAKLLSQQFAQQLTAAPRENRDEISRVRNKRAFSITPYAFDQQPKARPGLRSGLLFVGGFNHSPNVDGIVWFVQNVWRQLLERFPSLTLTIVGSNPPAAVLALSQAQNVKVTGYVTDEVLAQLYQETRLVVAPLRFGGGVKGKVVEAMAYGVPVVTTTAGAQGLEMARNALSVADEVDEYVDAVSQRLVDNNVWQTHSATGQQVVQRYFSPQALDQQMERYIRGY